MKHKHTYLIAFFVAFGTLGFAQQSAMAGMSQANHQVGKTGQLSITAPVTVGNTVLAPGDYEVQHVATPERHFVEFIRRTEVPYPGIRRPPQATPTYKREKMAEVDCRLEPLNAKTKKTVAITSSDARLTRLEIKGEHDAHVF